MLRPGAIEPVRRSLFLLQGCRSMSKTWAFPKIWGTILGTPKARMVAFGGLYRGPLFTEATTYSGVGAILGLYRDNGKDNGNYRDYRV